MDSLLTFLITMMLCVVYMLIRNNWVYKRRVKWNEMVYKYHENLISQNVRFNPNSYHEIYNAINSYNEMLYRFWRWDLSYFIKDQEKFDLIINNQYKEETKNGNYCSKERRKHEDRKKI